MASKALQRHPAGCWETTGPIRMGVEKVQAMGVISMFREFGNKERKSQEKVG